VATVEESPCPRCGASGTLSIRERLQAKPPGTHSLAGGQMKVSARSVPVLGCSDCGLSVDGVWDPDGRHATFPPVPPEN
jgi:hypothetical protein